MRSGRNEREYPRGNMSETTDDGYWYESIEMTPHERAAFLRQNRVALFSTVRRSGAPFGVPLGFLHEGEVFDETTPVYLSLGGRKTLLSRIRKDPRICMTVDDRQIPTSVIIAEGTAREVPDDDGSLIDRFYHGAGFKTAKSEEIDDEVFMRNSLAISRTAVRIDFDHIISWESRKFPEWRTLPAVHVAYRR